MKKNSSRIRLPSGNTPKMSPLIHKELNGRSNSLKKILATSQKKAAPVSTSTTKMLESMLNNKTKKIVNNRSEKTNSSSKSKHKRNRSSSIRDSVSLEKSLWSTIASASDPSLIRDHKHRRRPQNQQHQPTDNSLETVFKKTIRNPYNSNIHNIVKVKNKQVVGLRQHELSSFRHEDNKCSSKRFHLGLKTKCGLLTPLLTNKSKLGVDDDYCITRKRRKIDESDKEYGSKAHGEIPTATCCETMKSTVNPPTIQKDDNKILDESNVEIRHVSLIHNKQNRKSKFKRDIYSVGSFENNLGVHDSGKKGQSHELNNSKNSICTKKFTNEDESKRDHNNGTDVNHDEKVVLPESTKSHFIKALSIDSENAAQDNINGKSLGNNKTLNKMKNSKQKVTTHNENYVRLNLRNSAGACKGARNIRRYSSQKQLKTLNSKISNSHRNTDESRNEYDYDNHNKHIKRSTLSIDKAIDPLDDFVDGKFYEKNSGSNYPICPRHQRACKLLTVKKNTSGNKGRNFYACSMPKGEQCDFFQWAEDSVESAQQALLRSPSQSGFIARRVEAYSNRFKTMTVPELKVETKRRNLSSTGKKIALVTRLLLWVRDEIAKSSNDEEVDQLEIEAPEQENSELILEKGDIQISDQHDIIEDQNLGNDDNSEEDSSCLSCDEIEIIGNSTASTCNHSSIDTSESVESTPKTPLHTALHGLFGHLDFREGQEWVIRRTLSHKRSLLVAPTGMGKTLCYALPASLMNGLCIVVSPLISLMQDQLSQLPPGIPAVTLSGSLSTKEIAVIVNDLIHERYKILFVSPERLSSAAFRRLLRHKYNPDTKKFCRQLPPISLLCIDEAHCVSQWGHNFRSSYLRLKSLLDLLEPRSVLALTATASPPVVSDICDSLGIIDTDKHGIGSDNQKHQSTNKLDIQSKDNGVRVFDCNRSNIRVRVKFVDDEDARLHELLSLLKQKAKYYEEEDDNAKNIVLDCKRDSSDFVGSLSAGSVIIYVSRRKDTEIIAEQLCGAGIQGGVTCYHGGMDHESRTTSQRKFMNGKARICVATVAFGMGINKIDIAGVIHLCLPPSPEHYIQEIGRAGRDGRQAEAIALIIANEFHERHSMAHSDKICLSQIRMFYMIIQRCVNDILSLSNSSEHLKKIDIALPISKTVHATDLKEESITTILSLLENSSPSCRNILNIQGIIFDTAVITLKKRSIEKLSLDEQVIRCIELCGQRSDETHNGHQSIAKLGGTAMQKGYLAYSFGTIEFSVVKCARYLGDDAEPRHVYAALRRLQNSGEIEVYFDSLKGRCLHLQVESEGMKIFSQFDQNASLESSNNSHLDWITQHFQAQESSRVSKVKAIFDIMSAVSQQFPDKNTCSSESAVKSVKIQKSKTYRQDEFHQMIEKYFTISHQKASGDGHLSKEKVHDKISCVKHMDMNNTHTTAKLSSDVANLLQDPVLLTKSDEILSIKFGHNSFIDYTVLMITKILHGIDTARNPALEWYQHPLWGQWKTINFSSLLRSVQTLLPELDTC